LGSVTEMFALFSNNLGIVLLSNSRNHEGMAQIENAVFNYAMETDFIPSGDLNSDDAINDEDFDLLVNLILTGQYFYTSDLNRDNRLDILDLLELIEIITT